MSFVTGHLDHSTLSIPNLAVLKRKLESRLEPDHGSTLRASFSDIPPLELLAKEASAGLVFGDISTYWSSVTSLELLTLCLHPLLPSNSSRVCEISEASFLFSTNTTRKGKATIVLSAIEVVKSSSNPTDSQGVLFTAKRP